MDNLCRFSFLSIYMSLFLFVSYQIDQHNFKLLLLFTIAVLIIYQWFLPIQFLLTKYQWNECWFFTLMFFYIHTFLTTHVNICESQIKKLLFFYWYFLLKSSPCLLTSAKLHHWGHTKSFIQRSSLRCNIISSCFFNNQTAHEDILIDSTTHMIWDLD